MALQREIIYEWHVNGSCDFQFNKVEALRGCIKEVIVNGKKEDLVGERAKHHHVGQCFPQVERGVYFSGDSYSIAGTLELAIYLK